MVGAARGATGSRVAGAGGEGGVPGVEVAGGGLFWGLQTTGTRERAVGWRGKAQALAS